MYILENEKESLIHASKSQLVSDVHSSIICLRISSLPGIDYHRKRHCQPNLSDFVSELNQDNLGSLENKFLWMPFSLSCKEGMEMQPRLQYQQPVASHFIMRWPSPNWWRFACCKSAAR